MRGGGTPFREKKSRPLSNFPPPPRKANAGKEAETSVPIRRLEKTVREKQGVLFSDECCFRPLFILSTTDHENALVGNLLPKSFLLLLLDNPAGTAKRERAVEGVMKE